MAVFSLISPKVVAPARAGALITQLAGWGRVLMVPNDSSWGRKAKATFRQKGGKTVPASPPKPVKSTKILQAASQGFGSAPGAAFPAQFTRTPLQGEHKALLFPFPRCEEQSGSRWQRPGWGRSCSPQKFHSGGEASNQTHPCPESRKGLSLVFLLQQR